MRFPDTSISLFLLLKPFGDRMGAAKGFSITPERPICTTCSPYESPNTSTKPSFNGPTPRPPEKSKSTPPRLKASRLTKDSPFKERISAPTTRSLKLLNCFDYTPKKTRSSLTFLRQDSTTRFTSPIRIVASPRSSKPSCASPRGVLSENPPLKYRSSVARRRGRRLPLDASGEDNMQRAPLRFNRERRPSSALANLRLILFCRAFRRRRRRMEGDVPFRPVLRNCGDLI